MINHAKENERRDTACSELYVLLVKDALRLARNLTGRSQLQRSVTSQQMKVVSNLRSIDNKECLTWLLIDINQGDWCGGGAQSIGAAALQSGRYPGLDSSTEPSITSTA
jgi:hypothetical protein